VHGTARPPCVHALLPNAPGTRHPGLTGADPFPWPDIPRAGPSSGAVAEIRAHADNVMSKKRNFVAEPMPSHAPYRKDRADNLVPNPAPQLTNPRTQSRWPASQ